MAGLVAIQGARNRSLQRCFVSAMVLVLGAGCAARAQSSNTLGVSPSGHYVTYGGETLMLIGESGTQCVPQNANLNHRQWIDDCAARGIRAIHVWELLAPRQKQDGSVIETRWGYVYPGLTPWARHTSGSNGTDQLKRWNLQAFDEGANGDFTHYWPRMRDLCSYAKSKGIIVGITMFPGWSKGNHLGWEYHPFNAANGGHLTSNTQVVIIDSPGTEVWQQPWEQAWPNARKTQWIWEQLSKKFIDELNGMGNVFFVYFDEHSYSEGNMGDHFLNFFRSRNAVWVDWEARRGNVKWVMSDTLHSDDKHANAISGFSGSPARPYFNLEGPPYQGNTVRTSIWSFAIGGGHFIFHADEAQETAQTGIMGYDPNVPGGNKGTIKRDWVGYASRLFNEHVEDLDSLSPHDELTSSGAYCLADPGREYVVYSKIGASTTLSLNLSAGGGVYNCRFYDPRDGEYEPVFQRPGGGVQSFTLPSANDWVLHVVAQSSAPVAVIHAQPTSGMSPLMVNFDGSGSHDSDGGSIVAYAWDFQNDGTVDATGPMASQEFRGSVASVVRLTVTDNEARTGSSTVMITVTMPPGLAPGDFDGDNDVDQSDFSHLQVCLSGSGKPQSDPACPDADLDGDGDVDQSDHAVFSECISGANTPADPGCSS